MALSKLTADVENVSALSDQPNDIDGMSAADLKAVFDAASVAIKTFLNEVHIPEVEDAIGAAARGIALDGLSGNVLADNTVGSDKLKSDEGFEAVNTQNIREYAVTMAKLSMELQALLSKLVNNYNSLNTALSTKATYASLPEVAKTGSYNDILDKPTIPTVDAEISSTSTNPVQNRIIYTEIAKKANTSHAVNDTTYGLGAETKYGHVKLSDATNSSNDKTSGIAATPKAVKDAYDLANSKAPNSHVSAVASDTAFGHVKISAGTATLSSGSKSWSNVPVSNGGTNLTFNSNSIVFVQPAPSSKAQWDDNNVYCSSQGTNVLGFSATTNTSAAITVNVVIIKLS